MKTAKFKPSEYYTALKIRAMEIQDLRTGTLTEIPWLGLMFAVLPFIMALEGLWLAIERFVDLDQSVDIEDGIDIVTDQGRLDWLKVWDLMDTGDIEFGDKPT